MSAEDKTAAIRREVEERAEAFDSCNNIDAHVEAVYGVVIYGVPLNEEEVDLLIGLVDKDILTDKSFGVEPDDVALAVREMLERGKK